MMEPDEREDGGERTPSKPTTQDEYVAALPADVRDIAQGIRAAIHEGAPGATETIEYGMPAFSDRGAPFVYFAVWKTHVGLYPIHRAPAELEAEIAPYRHAKDTVRFPLGETIDFELVARLARFQRARAQETAKRRTTRVDTASRSIAASPDAVYRAFSELGALERWLPPNDMTGAMLHFDFREGGSYRMRLTYAEAQRGRGKTSADADEVLVRLTKLVPGRAVEQAVVFESEDPAFAGVMRMTWSMTPEGDRTLVTVRAEDVPEGIRPEDHEAAMTASLAQLALYLDRSRR